MNNDKVIMRKVYSLKKIYFILVYFLCMVVINVNVIRNACVKRSRDLCIISGMQYKNVQHTHFVLVYPDIKDILN